MDRHGGSTVWHKKGGDKDETDLREWWQMISYHAGPGSVEPTERFAHLETSVGWCC